MRLGLGLALLPQTFLTPGALQGLVAIPLEEHLTRDLNLIYSREHPLSTAARTLVSDLREGVNHTSVQAAAQVAAGVGRVADARAPDRKGVTLGL